MGKAANAAIWEQFQPRTDNQYPDTEERYTGPLTEAEWEQGYAEWKWDKDDATADELDRARWAYARPVARVRLWDETRVGL
ncbi:hypothetical protein PQR71_41535 [Paraburkholderia fungorum]|uniref:hypothetical protein n=1 Tax=Paraburkholderia fungorum TaxID=134537 RepID=UPI0038BD27D3